MHIMTAECRPILFL